MRLDEKLVRARKFIYLAGPFIAVAILKYNAHRDGKSVNYRGTKNAALLADTISSSTYAKWFVLSVANDLNIICDWGAKSLADALESGMCPKALVLNLTHNQIGDNGKAALANAFRHGKVPSGTKIVGVGPEIDQLCRDNDQPSKNKRRASTSIYHTPVKRSKKSESDADYSNGQQTLPSPGN